MKNLQWLICKIQILCYFISLYINPKLVKKHASQQTLFADWPPHKTLWLCHWFSEDRKWFKGVLYTCLALYCKQLKSGLKQMLPWLYTQEGTQLCDAENYKIKMEFQWQTNRTVFQADFKSVNILRIVTQRIVWKFSLCSLKTSVFRACLINQESPCWPNWF